MLAKKKVLNTEPKLSRAKKVQQTRLQKEVNDFGWLIDELKVLMDSDNADMNLKDDLDLIEEFGNDLHLI